MFKETFDGDVEKQKRKEIKIKIETALSKLIKPVLGKLSDNLF